MEVAILQAAVDRQRELLGPALLALDVCDLDSGLTLAGHSSRPDVAALFSEVTATIVRALADSGSAALGGRYVIDLEGDQALVVIEHGEQLQTSLLIDRSLIDTAVVLEQAVPQLLADYDAIDFGWPPAGRRRAGVLAGEPVLGAHLRD